MSQTLFRFSDKTSNCSKWPETCKKVILLFKKKHISGHFEQFDFLSENQNKGWDNWVKKAGQRESSVELKKTGAKPKFRGRE